MGSNGSVMIRTVLIMGTMDTKGEELAYLQTQLHAAGFRTLLVDVGILKEPHQTVDVSSWEVAREAGVDLRQVVAAGDRRRSVQVMIEGASLLTSRLFAQRKFDGVIGVGGGTGTHIVTEAMKTLPIGIPKLMVSTVACRDMRQVIGTKDITMMHSVVDMLGLNAVSKMILSNAAGAIAGMVQRHRPLRKERTLVGLTVFGFCTEGGMHAKRCMEELGYEMVAFHANGTGGMAMEDLIEQGILAAVLDFATHEFSDQLYNGYCSGIGPGRMETAGRKGVPQVIVPGGLDCIVLEFDSPKTVPPQFRDREIFWYDFRSGVRTSKEEMRIFAEDFSRKLNGARGPVKIVVPLKGWSEADKEGGPLYNPEINAFFVAELKRRLDNNIEIIEVQAHINEPAFSKVAVDTLHEMIKSSMG